MPEQANAPRARRKTRSGVVTSDKMTKTVTVSLVRRYAHPVYGKQVTRTKKVKARNLEGGGHCVGHRRADRRPSHGRCINVIVAHVRTLIG